MFTRMKGFFARRVDVISSWFYLRKVRREMFNAAVLVGKHVEYKQLVRTYRNDPIAKLQHYDRYRFSLELMRRSDAVHGYTLLLFIPLLALFTVGGQLLLGGVVPHMQTVMVGVLTVCMTVVPLLGGFLLLPYHGSDYVRRECRVHLQAAYDLDIPWSL